MMARVRLSDRNKLPIFRVDLVDIGRIEKNAKVLCKDADNL